MARIKIFNEVKLSELEGRELEWDLCLQEGLYIYDGNFEPEPGFRFIYRKHDGSLQPARGGARLPSLDIAEKLIAEARKRGWGNNIY